MTTPSLHNLQLWLKWAITDPRGVHEALQDPTPDVAQFRDRYTSPTRSYLESINGGGMTSIQRLDVYAEAYFARLLESLGSDFPRTKKVVGDGAFNKLVAEYLKMYPSKFTSIGEVGYRFADFLSQTRVMDLGQWIFDLAAFEWSWIESFYAKDIDPQPDWQRQLSSNPSASLLVDPSLRLIQSQWSINKLIKVMDSDTETATVDEIKLVPTKLMIYRHRDAVVWEEITTPAFQILQSLKEGTPLDETLSRVEDLDPEEMTKAFTRWVERGLIYGITNEKK